jgi:hypothetical protein
MTPPIIPEQAMLVGNALSDIKFGLDFAYEQGLHEFGYDPAKTVADHIEAQASLLNMLREALKKARDKFLHYEELHRLKCTSEGDEKADRNREMADELTEALATLKSREK